MIRFFIIFLLNNAYYGLRFRFIFQIVIETKIKHLTSSIFFTMFTGLWGIVNNAGLSTFGEVEWCNLDVYKRISEVNVFGAIRVTKTFLPLVRKAKGKSDTAVYRKSIYPRLALTCYSTRWQNAVFQSGERRATLC